MHVRVRGLGLGTGQLQVIMERLDEWSPDVEFGFKFTRTYRKSPRPARTRSRGRVGVKRWDGVDGEGEESSESRSYGFELPMDDVWPASEEEGGTPLELKNSESVSSVELLLPDDPSTTDSSPELTAVRYEVVDPGAGYHRMQRAVIRPRSETTSGTDAGS